VRMAFESDMAASLVSFLTTSYSRGFLPSWEKVKASLSSSSLLL
jgi:hypothetical protein